MFFVCFSKAIINTDLEELPVNYALLQLVLLNGTPEGSEEQQDFVPNNLLPEDCRYYLQSKKCIEELALYLKPFSTGEIAMGMMTLLFAFMMWLVY